MSAGHQCDDGDRTTTADECESSDDNAACTGVVSLVSSIVFVVPIEFLETLDLPGSDVDASNIAVAIRAAMVPPLAASFGSDVDMVILSISAGSLHIDYRV